jgi:exopolysaccharide biosynthesis polyprenyl glycosylphosphotransferase
LLPLGVTRAHAADAALPASARRRGWSASQRTLLLALGDAGIEVAAMLATQLVGGTVRPNGAVVLRWVVLLTAVWLAATRALNVYDPALAVRLRDALPRTAVAAALAMGIYTAIPYWSPPLPPSRLLLLLNVGLVFAPLLAWRTASALLFTRPAWRIPVLVLGHGDTAAAVAAILRQQTWHTYRLVDTAEQRSDWRDEPATAQGLVRLVRERGIREIVVDGEAQRAPSLQNALLELAEQQVAVVTATDMYEALTGRVLPPSADVATLIKTSATMGVYDAGRRLVDVVVAAAGLVLLAPLLAAAAVAIRLDSDGYPLYWQPRVGRWNRPFRLVKLRTMVEHAEVDGQPVWARSADPRVTRVGAQRRRTRFDEVPQLWNVLRGEMSLIGPRPERPEFVALLSEELALYPARHVVRPGITGWAQVKFKYGSSVDDAATKLQYDLYYVRHRSPSLDAIIALETLYVVLRCRGL